MNRLPAAPFFFFEDHGDVTRPYAGRLYAQPRRLLVARRFSEVRSLLQAVDAARREGFHVAGFLAYEAAGAFEPTLATVLDEPDGDELPLALFGIFDRVWQLDRRQRDALLPACGRERTIALEAEPVVARAHFLAAVEAARAAMAAGDVYQLNLTFPLRLRDIGDPLAFYDRLCACQPVAHAAYVDLGDQQILSLSPELFVAGAGTRLVTRPMKGTQARHPDPRADRQRARLLAADPKNRAENLMIVDLLRNDLARLARRGSVRVERLFALERYPTVWQMTSTITAETGAPPALLPLFEALFPCGSVTGAPKIRAMEWIARLERHRRGVYTGTIGWAEPVDGNDAPPLARFSFNVAIRTIVTDGRGAGRLSVGAGIVWDSVAEAEYDECLLKGRFALAARSEPVTLIETMRVDPKSGVHLKDRHLCRLIHSAQVLGFVCRRADVEEALARWRAALADQDDKVLRLRLRLWRDGRIHLDHEPLTALPSPLKVALVSGGRRPDDPLCQHKVSDRRPLAEALAAARARWKADEVLFVSPAGELREGSYTTLFVRMPGQQTFLTPPLSAGILPGVLRADLLARGRARVARLYLQDLARAEEIFMGNALRGLMAARIVTENCHNMAVIS